jgi:hypothetical protein
MADIAELKPDDASSEFVSGTAPPNANTTPEPDEISQLLAEFEQKTAAPEPEQNTANATNAPLGDDLDRQIAEILGPDPKVAELQGQVDSLQAENYRRDELQAFNEMAKDLDQQMPSWLVGTGYAEARLKALAHDQTIALAWDLRNTDQAVAKQELLKVRWELMQSNPDPGRVQELQNYGARLEIAINAHAILRKARLDIINSASKLPKPIDEEVSGWRSEIAASMRGASMPIDFKDPPPNFGNMTDAEFRDFTKRNYGF